jgi:hypothetical protein
MVEITKEITYETIANRNVISVTITNNEFYLSYLTFHIMDLMPLLQLIGNVTLEEGYMKDEERSLLTKFLKEMEEIE